MKIQSVSSNYNTKAYNSDISFKSHIYSRMKMPCSDGCLCVKDMSDQSILEKFVEKIFWQIRNLAVKQGDLPEDCMLFLYRINNKTKTEGKTLDMLIVDKSITAEGKQVENKMSNAEYLDKLKASKNTKIVPFEIDNQKICPIVPSYLN